MTPIAIRDRIAALLHDAAQCGMPEREAICAALEAIEPLRERLAEIDDGLDFDEPKQSDQGPLENLVFVGGSLDGKTYPVPWNHARVSSLSGETYVRHEIKPHVMVLLERGE